MTIPLAIAVWFEAAFSLYVASGPLSRAIPISTCGENWWHNLLYIHIYVEDGPTCVGQTWYLATDMSLFLVSPLLLFPMFYWQEKQGWWGLKVWALFAFVFTLVPLGLTIKYGLPPYGIM